MTNISAFKALCIPQAFYRGRIYDCALMKATFKIAHDGTPIPLANQPDFGLNDTAEPEATAAERRWQKPPKRRKPDAEPYDAEDYASDNAHVGVLGQGWTLPLSLTIEHQGRAG